MINKLSHIDYDVPGRIGLDEQRSTVGRCHDEDIRKISLARRPSDIAPLINAISRTLADAILFMPVVSFSVS
jgi:hypothetical protein